MKKIETGFTRAIFLGKLHGEDVFLAPPSWDCGWYWGFGYIRNRNLHTHYNCLCLKKLEKYNYKKQVYELTDFIHILEQNPNFQTTLSRSKQWQLSDYMKSFYALKEASEVLGRGSSHYTGQVNTSIKNTSMSRKIDSVILPKLFNDIYLLLK
jgi:hypothetical protein